MTDFIAPPCHAPLRYALVRDDCLFVDKPAGLLSVPGRHPQNRDSVATRVEAEYPRARIVHRLDMDTSGLMVLALGADPHRHLSRQFQERLCQKRYRALVDGTVADDEGEVDLPLICDWPNRPRQMVDHQHGKPSRTRYRVLERSNGTSLLELTPVTGRSHQLRVHMAALGHPILGDPFYAGEEARKAAPRLLLHACQLEIAAPSGDGTLCLHSPASF